MERRSFLGALTSVSLGVALTHSFTEFARAQNRSQAGAGSPGQASKTGEFPPNSSIVLVHGAWADGSCWRNIILPLEQRGLHVICAPIPMTSLTNDATALSRALECTSGPVVLVGHAYSGAVIAAVREDRVKSLVYISALAPDEGETVAQVFYRPPIASGNAETGSRFIWLYMDARRWISSRSRPQGFSRSNKHRNCRATADRGSVHSRVCPGAVMENEAVVVPDRRRGSHDQSEDVTFHGRSYASKNSVASCRPFSNVHRAAACGACHPGRGARDALAIAVLSGTDLISDWARIQRWKPSIRPPPLQREAS